MDIESLLNPHMLHDEQVYLAFYPQKDWDSGGLLSPSAD
jgi:hypothetical protein